MYNSAGWHREREREKDTETTHSLGRLKRGMYSVDAELLGESKYEDNEKEEGEEAEKGANNQKKN